MGDTETSARFKQSGETFDTRDSTPRINGFAPQIRESIATESTNKEKGSQDPRERREDKGSIESDTLETGLETETDDENGLREHDDNLDNGLETETDKGNGYENKFECCGRVFASHRGLRIHQGKKCQRKTAVQHRRSEDRKMTGRIPQEANHSGNDPALEQTKESIGERKPKIKWPKANETALCKQFDEEVNKKLIKMKGTMDQKLEKLAGTIYEEGLKQFGLEVEKKAKGRAPPRRSSRRQDKIEEVKKEKKEQL